MTDKLTGETIDCRCLGLEYRIDYGLFTSIPWTVRVT